MNRSNIPDMIISSRHLNKNYLLGSYLNEDIILYEKVQNIIYSPEWITDSIISKKLVDNRKYKIELRNGRDIIDKKTNLRIELPKVKRKLPKSDSSDSKNNINRYKSKRKKSVVKNKKYMEDYLPIPLASLTLNEKKDTENYNFQNTLNHKNEEKSYEKLIQRYKSKKPQIKENRDKIIKYTEAEEKFLSDSSGNISYFNADSEVNCLDLENKLSIKSTKASTTNEVDYQENLDDHILQYEENIEPVNNLNSHIIDHLEKIMDFYTSNNDEFQALIYRRAIAQLKYCKETITSISDIEHFPYIGKSIKEKIKEILHSGKCTKSEFLSNDPKTKSLKELSKVYGVGINLANKFYNMGITNIEQLRKNKHLLKGNQLIGLKYCEDLSQRIPRAEVSEIADVVKKELYKILPENLLKVELCGSYRRGKETVSDVDILITRTDEGAVTGILDSLVKNLKKTGCILEILSLSHSASGGRSQFMGICKLQTNSNSLHRRIDIRVYHKKHYPFALLYFTGSANFNRTMRLYANKLGYNLSDLSLEFLGSYKTRIHQLSGKNVICEYEEDIFRKLGLDYVYPKKREI
jgi:DNA polymerase lambda